MSALRFELRDPASLRPYLRNARTHPKRQLEQLKASITSVGFTNPILVDDADTIIAGHGRLLAAKALGLAEVPVVVVSGLTETQKTQLRVADNKIALNAGWDLDLLRAEIQSIVEIDVRFEFSAIGFATGEIDKLLNMKVALDDDQVPPLTQTPVSILGDVWILGPHRLLCGDCRVDGALAALVAGELVDCAFLDAPFNLRISGFAVGRGRHREFAEAVGELSSSEFETFLREGLSACVSVSREGAVHFLCMDHRHIEELIAACKGLYGARLNICVWNKTNGGMGSLYRSKHELVFVQRVGQAQPVNNVELGRHGRYRTNVWDYPGVNSRAGSRRDDLDLHPTTKPVQMVADAIMDVTNRGDLVLDAYLGSGTTLIACERTARHFVGCEIDPAYVDVAIERWEGLTGQNAIHAASGETFRERQRRAA